MKSLRPLMILAAAVTAASSFAASDLAADKVLVTDGSMVHNVGSLSLNVTNFGLLGATPGGSGDWSNAPSARWNGVDHLWLAGLWVGAKVDAGEGTEVRVSTYAYEWEFRPTDDPLDTIYEAEGGVIGGRRYPALGPNDDFDSEEDEDPLNGLDDDGDGQIDEDFATIGDQYFRCLLRDDTAAAQSLYPDHAPLGLQIVQESFQWSEAPWDAMVGFRFTIRNIGDHTLEDVHLGFFGDPDVGNGGGESSDDAAFVLQGTTMVEGEIVDYHVVGAHDSAGGVGLMGGWIGLTLLGDSTGGAPHNGWIFAGQNPFEMGGDPVNDQQRYLLMESAGSSSSTLPGRENDMRVLTSCSAIDSLAPGESVVLDAAIVVGADEADLIEAAARAAYVRNGHDFDRNGWPSDGYEFHVPWLIPDEIPVANEPGDDLPEIRALALEAHPNPFNPSTELVFELERPGRARLEAYDLAGRLVAVLADDRMPAGLHRTTWNGRADDGRLLPAGGYMLLLRTEEGTVGRKVSLVK